MNQVLEPGTNWNARGFNRYAHENPKFGEVIEERSINHDRHRLKLFHNSKCIFDKTTDDEISDAVIDEIVRGYAYFLNVTPATPKQLGRLAPALRSRQSR